MRSGQLFEQATWEPHTGESESSLWPTALASDGTSGKEHHHHGTSNPSLLGAVRSWPTPCSRDEKGAYTNHRQGGRDLSSEIEKWPTPIASDANGPRAEDGKRSVGLNTRVLDRTEWPTPTAAGLGGNTSRNGEKRHAQDSTVTLTEAVRCWPTPTAGDRKASGSRNLPGSAAHAGESLTDAVIHEGSRTPRGWPTPRAEDSESTGAHRGVPDTLTSAVRAMWQTPVADDAMEREKGKWNSRGEPKLSAQVMFPTPSATPYGRQKTGTVGAAVRPSLETQARSKGMQLNPAWVETLMGFPIGWTAGPPGPVKSKKRGSRPARSRPKSIGTVGRA